MKGTRVPFIVRWPARVKPGVSDALVSQVDFLASFAALTGQTLAQADGPDSLDTLAAFLGTSKTGRHELVEQAGGQALRVDQWKYMEPSKRARLNEQVNIELGNDAVPQLYDLAKDPGETTNLAAKYPEKVKEMDARLQAIRKSGRSR
jgi:arylsulfatase A-like enzyme